MERGSTALLVEAIALGLASCGAVVAGIVLGVSTIRAGRRVIRAHRAWSAVEPPSPARPSGPSAGVFPVAALRLPLGLSLVFLSCLSAGLIWTTLTWPTTPGRELLAMLPAGWLIAVATITANWCLLSGWVKTRRRPTPSTGHSGRRSHADPKRAGGA